MQLCWRTRYPGPRHFSQERKRALEYLDRRDLDPAEKLRSYRDLDTISQLPAQFGPLWRVLGRLAGRHPEGGQPSLTVLELGAGTGRIGLRIARLLERAGHQVKLISTDVRPQQLPVAGRSGNVTIHPQRLDALQDPLPPVDLCFANLLIHHFDREEALRLLSRMRAATRLGGAVFDLDRNPWAFHFLRMFFPLWVRSPVTVADALSSVQQAFRLDELEKMALAAGIEKPHLRRIWGLRSLVWWGRNSEWRTENEAPPVEPVVSGSLLKGGETLGRDSCSYPLPVPVPNQRHGEQRFIDGPWFPTRCRQGFARVFGSCPTARSS